jgi:hypothetical protein
MIKIYVIKSLHSGLPLAEIRTDGHAIEVIVDNTEGEITNLAAQGLKALEATLAQSSHLSMEPATEATPRLLRYVLSTGESVEITTDGKTATVNGKLIDEQKKQMLFQMIAGGQVKVTHKDSPDQALPIYPEHKKNPMDSIKAHNDSSEMISKIAKKAREDKDKETPADENHDSHIESLDYSEFDDPKFVKNTLYLMKHGKYGNRG